MPEPNAAGDSLESQPEPPDSEQPSEHCASCHHRRSWEAIVDAWGERWISVCGCGEIATFFPDRRHPDEEPPEPLVTALQGHRAPRRPATPAWVRVFLASLQQPHEIQWRHHYEPCPACQSPARFGLLAWPQPDIAAICALCLACGHTVSHYHQATTGKQQPPLEGTSWTPACPAVKRLRQCIFHSALQPEPGDSMHSS